MDLLGIFEVNLFKKQYTRNNNVFKVILINFLVKITRRMALVVRLYEFNNAFMDF